MDGALALIPTIDDLRAKNPYCDEACLQHHQQWWRQHERREIAAEEYEKKYPDYCKSCGGSGFEGYWSSFPDPCPANRCYEDGYCPRCRQLGAVEGLGGIPWEDPEGWIENGADQCLWCGWRWSGEGSHPMAGFEDECYYCTCEEDHWGRVYRDSERR